MTRQQRLTHLKEAMYHLNATTTEVIQALGDNRRLEHLRNLLLVAETLLEEEINKLQANQGG